MTWRFLAPAALACLTGSGALATACGGAAGESKTATPEAARAAGSAAAGKVNIDAIFPAGRGRELLLNNCTSCHTFVPIVVLQMARGAWERNKLIHRDRVTALDDADFEALYEYLIANFNPDHPVPKLPKELLATWTSY